MAFEKDEIISQSEESKPYLNKSLHRMIKDLLKIWWLFLIVGLLAGIAGVFYAIEQKTTYKSRLTFALDDGDQNSIGGFLNLASQFGLNIGGSKDIFGGDNIIEILKSRRMIERVLLSVDTFQYKPFTLIEYYLEISEKRKSNLKIKDIHFPVGQLKNTFTYQQDSLLYTVYKDFSQTYTDAQRPDRKLSIYEVSITSPDEKFTKDFTDRLVFETNNFYTEIRTKKAKETLDILEQRVASMKGSLNSSINNKASVQDVNINPAFSEGQVPAQKQQANIQVYGAAYSELFKNLELARFQYLNEIPLLQIIDEANYPMQKIKPGKLKTGIIFSFVSCFLIVFIFWLIRILKISRLNTPKES